MALDPITSLTASVLLLFCVGGLMLSAAWKGHAGGDLRWSGAAVLCLGFGFAMLLIAPTDIQAPVRMVGNALLMLAHGLLWGAARVVNRRSRPFEIVVAGALAWLVLASTFDPSQAWRIGVTSAIVVAYGSATAFEHRGGHGPAGPARRWASWIFTGHATFYLLRTIIGPTFGLLPWGPNAAGFWGTLTALEAVVMAVLVGVVSIAMRREPGAGLRRRDGLEDLLTGIGNGRALFRSGSVLIEATRAEGRPAALLLMDLDRFKAVNELHGHPAGDRLLVAFARLAHEYLPPTSLVCRLGGQEFAAVVPGADAARARTVADEIRALFAHLAIDGARGPVGTTVSIGVALVDPERDEVAAEDGGAVLAALLARADECLSAAKTAGRDRVVAEGDPILSGRAA